LVCFYAACQAHWNFSSSMQLFCPDPDSRSAVQQIIIFTSCHNTTVPFSTRMNLMQDLISVSAFKMHSNIINLSYARFPVGFPTKISYSDLYIVTDPWRGSCVFFLATFSNRKWLYVETRYKLHPEDGGSRFLRNSVNFFQNTRYHILEKRILQNFYCQLVARYIYLMFPLLHVSAVVKEMQVCLAYTTYITTRVHAYHWKTFDFFRDLHIYSHVQLFEGHCLLKKNAVGICLNKY
jgi:hypothetical protein